MFGIIRRLAERLPMREPLRRVLATVKRAVNRKRARHVHTHSLQKSKRRQVLVLMNGGLGNSVDATPLIQAIQTHWPQARLTLLTPYVDLFDGWCMLHEIISSPEAVRGRSWDDTFVTWSAVIPAEEERGTTHWGIIHRIPLRGAWFIKPEREYNVDMIRHLGFRGASPPLYVSLRQPAAWLKEPGPWIAIVPGGQTGPRWHNKRWPHFPELATALLSHSANVHLCIIGGSDDRPMTHFQANDRLFDMRGQLTLAESAWVLKQMMLAIGNDCGPMHIAEAVHVPTLVLFGPTCELKNGPLQGGKVLSTSIACRPCQYVKTNFTCNDPRCLSELTVDDVLRCLVPCLSESPDALSLQLPRSPSPSTSACASHRPHES